MELTPQLIDRFRDALQRESLRLTPQRLAVLEDVLETEAHRECDDIHLSLKKKGLQVSRATIYRTLDIMYKTGFVRRMDIGDGRIRYENKLPKPHHDHIICVQCGRIIEFVDEEIERRQVDISRKHDFVLIHHIHQLFGTCSQCQEK